MTFVPGDGQARLRAGLCARCGQHPKEKHGTWCWRCALHDEVNPGRARNHLPPMTEAEYCEIFEVPEDQR